MRGRTAIAVFGAALALAARSGAEEPALPSVALDVLAACHEGAPGWAAAGARFEALGFVYAGETDANRSFNPTWVAATPPASDGGREVEAILFTADGGGYCGVTLPDRWIEPALPEIGAFVAERLGGASEPVETDEGVEWPLGGGLVAATGFAGITDGFFALVIATRD